MAPLLMTQNDSSTFLHQLLDAVAPVLAAEMKPTTFAAVPVLSDAEPKTRETDALLDVAISSVLECEDSEVLPDLSSRIAMLILFDDRFELLRDRMLKSLFS